MKRWTGRTGGTTAALALGGLLLTGCGGGGGGGSAAPGPAASSHYTYTDLGSLGYGERTGGTFPAAISNGGVIVGVTSAVGAHRHAFRHVGAGPVTAADDLGGFPGVDPQIGGSVFATAVNAAGVVAGYADIDNINGDEQHAFVYDTAFHDLGSIPAAHGRYAATLSGINAGGTVVGQAVFPDQGPPQDVPSRAFRHTGLGPLTAADEIDQGGYTDVVPAGVNDAGLVVGRAAVNTLTLAQAHAFAYDAAFHDLGVLPGALSSQATAVNNAGVIVGTATRPDGYFRAFRHSGLAALTAADDLGAASGFSGSTAVAVNAAGVVVGTLYAATREHAFVCSAGGAMRDLNDSALVSNLPAGAELMYATGVNDQGQIVGYSYDADVVAHGWLLTPAP